MGISVIGCGDYEALMTDRISKTSLSMLPSCVIDGNFKKILDLKDPVNNWKAFKGKKLLLINGGKDKLVPFSCNKSFLEKIEKEVYDVLVYIDPEAEHRFTDPMRECLFNWLKDQLSALVVESKE
jgi:hypothetical protein